MLLTCKSPIKPYKPFHPKDVPQAGAKHGRLGARGFHPRHDLTDPAWSKDTNAFISLINLICLP